MTKGKSLLNTLLRTDSKNPQELLDLKILI